MDFYLQRLQDAITSATEGLSPEELARHPEGKWCTGEILEHLYLTYTGTIKGFERCIAKGQPTARTPQIMDYLRKFVVIGMNHLPEGRKAPTNTVPKGMSAEQVRGEIAAAISKMDAIIAKAEKKYGRNTLLLDHPIIGPLRGEEWRKFHWVHGNHHLKQIARLCRGNHRPLK
jgi:Protein of unknown function (DUF1569)